MNWDQVSGRWTEFKGKAKEAWGDLTDDDLDRAAGKRDQMVGLMQKKYGDSKEAAEKRLDDWANKL